MKNKKSSKKKQKKPKIETKKLETRLPAAAASGKSFKKKINNIISAEKLIPVAMPFSLFLKHDATPTPIRTVSTERKNPRFKYQVQQ